MLNHQNLFHISYAIFHISYFIWHMKYDHASERLFRCLFTGLEPSKRLYQQDDLVGGRDLWPRVQGVVTHLFDVFQNASPAQPGQSQLEGKPPADQTRQRLSAIEQLPRPFDLEFEQRGVTFAESFLPQVIVADPEPCHLILRQVDPILPYVDFHILPKIGELQRRANAIRKAVQALLAVTEQKQDQTADRVRRARAIIEDLVEIGVAPFDHVLLEGRKQVAEELNRQLQFTDRFRQRDEDRMVGLAPITVFQFSLPIVERGQSPRLGGSASFVTFVGEVVRDSGERVYAVDVSAAVSGYEQRAYGKILVMRPGQAFAIGESLGHTSRRRLRPWFPGLCLNAHN